MSTPTVKELKKILGNIAPQFFDELLQDWSVQRGKDGASYVHLTNEATVNQVGSIVEDYWEGESSVTKTFSTPMNGFSIANDGLEVLTFTINGVTRTVYPGEPYNGNLKPFTQVTINATDKYRAEVLK